MRVRQVWAPWMLAEYGLHPWMLRDYTQSELEQLVADMRQRQEED